MSSADQADPGRPNSRKPTIEVIEQVVSLSSADTKFGGTSTGITVTITEEPESRAVNSSQPASFWHHTGSWNIYNLRHSILRALVTMAILAVCGLSAALGHHMYWASLNETEVINSEPNWPQIAGLILAFFAKSAMIAAVKVAYKQQAWVRGVV
jgi:hypothetical protein